jgi:hypothetical protein
MLGRKKTKHKYCSKSRHPRNQKFLDDDYDIQPPIKKKELEDENTE